MDQVRASWKLAIPRISRSALWSTESPADNEGKVMTRRRSSRLSSGNLGRRTPEEAADMAGIFNVCTKVKRFVDLFEVCRDDFIDMSIVIAAVQIRVPSLEPLDR
jgi:hypothetical protein